MNRGVSHGVHQGGSVSAGGDPGTGDDPTTGDDQAVGDPPGAGSNRARSNVIAGLRLAVGTLTIVPVGDVGTLTPGVARWAMSLAPLAVAPLALGALTLAWAAGLVALPPLLTGALVVGALGLGSRGMHLDGLADTVDGLAAGWDRERALAVMRKGDVGPLGAAALIVVLLGEAAAISALATRPWGWAIIGWAVLASRVACTALTVRGLPAARPDGLGAAVADVVPPGVLVVVTTVVAGLGATVGWLSGWPWWQPLAAVLVASAGLAWLARTARRVLGGTTGDVFGAGVEVAFVLLLGCLAAGTVR